jgi:Bacterial alpha-L-rhamnosidase.
MNYEMKKTDTKLLDDAYWIGAPIIQEDMRETRLRVETAYFKNSFFLSEKTECIITLSAHSRYKLYVNGYFVTYGPCKGDIYRRYCDEVSIGEYLKEGENIIFLQVMGYPPYEAGSETQKGPDWSENRACGACIMLAGSIKTSKETVRLTTGHGDWQVHVSNELTPRYDSQSSVWLGYLEQIDLKQHVQSAETGKFEWNTPLKLWDTEDSAFGIIPVFELYDRPIPLQILKKRNFASQMPTLKNTEGFFTLQLKNSVTVPKNTAAVIELDAGELTTGFFRLPIEGGAGAKITVLYSEAYGVKNGGDRYIKTVRDDWENGELEGHSDICIPSGEKTVYEPFWFRTFRYIRLEIETGDAPVTLHTPTYLETGYPLEEKTKPLAASQPWISDIWDISLRTLRRCMHETYEDCPYYEQMQYTLDTRLQMLFTYAVCGDRRMPFRTIYDYHASLLPNGMLQSRYPCETRQVIPPFALHWISMIDDFYWESGDKEIIRRYIPTMEAVLGYFRRHKKDGLAEKLGYWEFVDWAPEWDETHGVPNACKHGPSVTINFIYAYTLRLAAKLMRVIGFSDFAESYESEAAEICRILNAKCYNSKKGLYRDGPNVEEYSQHAQVWAVLAGAESPEFCRALMERVSEDDTLIACTFPLQFYLFRAYERTGLYSHTEKLWEMWKRLIPMHLTTVPEIPDKSRSDCHAWGSILLFEFPRKILGVEAETPGYEVISIRPKAEFISSASGTVHTPKGDIKVWYAWKNEMFKLKVSHSCDSEVVAYLPDGEKVSCASGQESEFLQRKI